MSFKMKLKMLLKNVNSNKRKAENIREINYQELKRLLRSELQITIVDVRSPQEFAENKIKFAINIPLYDIGREAQVLLPDKNGLIVLYCQCGTRSKKAYEILEKNGYTNLYSLYGGLDNI